MSLKAWYKLDGNALDSVGNLDGTEGITSWVDGKIGTCGNFDGVNDVVSLGIGSDLFPLPNFSISCWFKSYGTTATTGTAPAICGFTYGIRLSVNSNNISFGLDNGSAFTYITSPSTYDFYNDNQWHHVVATATSTERNLYIDGEHVGTRTDTWLGETRWITNGLNIGRDNNNSNYHFRGLIDDFRIYDHALSLKEVKELSKAPALHYSFNNILVESIKGLSVGMGQNDLSFFPNQWLGSANTGELDITGTYFEDFDGVSHSITPINNGVATDDANTGVNYLMYSVESVHTRFSTNPPNASNCDHLICIDFIDGQWQYDSNSGFYTFDITNTDLIVAEVGKDFGVTYIDAHFFNRKVTDSTGNNDPMELAIDGATSPIWVPDSALGSGSYYFRGNSSLDGMYALYDDQAGIIENEFSVACWFKCNTTSGEATARIISRDASDYFAICVQHAETCPQDILFYFSGSQNITINDLVLPDTWHHIVGTWNVSTTTFKFYFDGIEVYSTASLAAFTTTTRDIVIGCNSESGINPAFSPFEGWIDDVRIYASELTQEDITELYQTRASIDDNGSLHVNELVENVVNRCPNFDKWSLSNAYLEDNGTLVITDGGRADSPYIYVGGMPSSWDFSAWYHSYTKTQNAAYDPDSGVLMGSTHYDAGFNLIANDSGYTSNGHAERFPVNEWTRLNWNNSAGTQVKYIKINMSENATYTSLEFRVSSPMLIDSASSYDYINDSYLPANLSLTPAADVSENKILQHQVFSILQS
jgi:hypothetical protein